MLLLLLTNSSAVIDWLQFRGDALLRTDVEAS